MSRDIRQAGSSGIDMKYRSPDPVGGGGLSLAAGTSAAKGTPERTQGFDTWGANAGLGEYGCGVGRSKCLGVMCSGCVIPNSLFDSMDLGDAMVSVISS